MMKYRIFLWVVFFLSVCTGAVLFSDELTLKNGKVISNVRTQLGKNAVTVEHEDGRKESFEKSDVKSVQNRPLVWKAKEKKEEAVSLKTFKNSIGMEFVLIPAGEFLMGCSDGDRDCSEDEKPQQNVRITKPFYMGKYEVTQKQWQTVMGDNPSKFNDCGENCPVEYVSWNKAENFLEKLCEMEKPDSRIFFVKLFSKRKDCRYRLPTEAEWEYAARGGAKEARYADDIYSLAWFSVNSSERTHPVGLKRPNAFGLYDMLGNVWEWTADRYGDYQAGQQNDPLGPVSGSIRVLRGGSWFTAVTGIRASLRYRSDPAGRNGDIGLRLVLELQD